MAEYHAKNRKVLMEIFVPYPAELLVIVEDTHRKISEVLSRLPDWSRPMTRPYYEWQPEIKDFVNTIDWDGVRNEFSRKAKKLSLTAPNDILIEEQSRCILLSVWAK